MGNQYTVPVQYRTKDGLRISYILYDLKGKNRFPDQPGDSQIDFMFERCLEQIDAEANHMKEIKHFNSKYKYRFTILHKRKVEEARKYRQLEDLRRSSFEINQIQLLKHTQQKSKTKELEELIRQVELNQTLIKMPLMKIDKYLTQKYAHLQFIEIRGFERLLQLLDKGIRINNSGTKTNFSNQIELLKFFKLFSDRYPKDFYNYVPKINNYASIIMRTYHPVNTHITSYCLNLLTDYLWRVQEGDHVVKILQAYRLQHNYETFLSPFADTVNETDNILMTFYNMKFINELIASVIEEDKKELLKQSLTYVKYGYVLDGIKAKLQQNYFHLDNTTFISMHQKIFKYATKNNKIQKKLFQENRVSFRNTFNLNALHQQILLKLVDNDNQVQQDEYEDNSEQSIVAFLAESDRKSFNKFILDTLTELQKFSKLEFQLQNLSKNGEFLEESQQMVESKIYLTNVENYFTRIKQACTKNNCNQIMTNCFKNLQYFQKSQWKHLERFILEELGLERKVLDELEELKKTLDEKETMIKRIIKQNIDLRNQLSELRMKEGSHSERNVGKLSQESSQFLQVSCENMNQTIEEMNFSKKSALNLPLPPPGVKRKIQLPKMPLSLNKYIVTSQALPSPPRKREQGGKFEKPMRDKPKLNIQSRNINMSVLASDNDVKGLNANKPLTQLNNNLQTVPSLLGYKLPPPSLLGLNTLPPSPSLGVINLPPPPSLGNANLSQLPSMSGGILPPPPSLGSMTLPPPPSLGTGMLPPLSTLLPPPPTLGSNTLSPPPTLSGLSLPLPPPSGSVILPPPPPLGSVILPPPPGLSGSGLPSLPNLPSPPTLNSGILPPPPSLGFNILPPPPTLGSNILPPPPSFNPSILPPPPSLGSSMLPPPPTLGTFTLPPPLSGNIMPPLIGPVSNLPMPGIMNQTVQKIKEKRKPKVPLKVCNYTIMPYDKIIGSIFEEIDDTKLQWDEDELAQLFAKTGPQPNKQSHDQTKTKSLPQTIKQVVKLLGADRWRNAEIILTKLRIPLGQVTKALTQCTGKYTSYSNLQSIMKLAPNQEEQQMIKTYEGNVQDLGKPQKFLKQLIEVPEYLNRIKSMIFSNIKEEFYYELSSKIQQLQTGFKSLKQNKRLKQVILLCLGLGNYLNGTTLKGGAWGFKIETMERLEEITSNDNKMNAAFFLIRQLWKEYPYPIFEKEQIDLYQYLSKIPVSQISQEVGQLRTNLKAVERAFKSHDKNNPNDHIGPYCEEVMMELSVKVEQYKTSAQNLNQLYLDCAKYYCEDGKKTSSDEFGKKMFQSILFISNTQKMFKVIEDKRIKDQYRKATKNQLTYSEVKNPQSLKKPEKKIPEKTQIKKVEPLKVLLPDPTKLITKPPLPPKIFNKEEKLKQMQKIQQEREKKSLQEIMMRRTSKLQAYRMSKMSQVSTKKSVQEIDFLRGIN